MVMDTAEAPPIDGATLAEPAAPVELQTSAPLPADAAPPPPSFVLPDDVPDDVLREQPRIKAIAEAERVKVEAEAVERTNAKNRREVKEWQARGTAVETLHNLHTRALESGEALDKGRLHELLQLSHVANQYETVDLLEGIAKSDLPPGTGIPPGLQRAIDAGKRFYEQSPDKDLVPYARAVFALGAHVMEPKLRAEITKEVTAKLRAENEVARLQAAAAAREGLPEPTNVAGSGPAGNSPTELAGLEAKLARGGLTDAEWGVYDQARRRAGLS